MFYKVDIKENEVGFLFKNEKFVRVLNAGPHRFIKGGANYRTEKVNTDYPLIRFQEIQSIAHLPELKAKIRKVAVSENQRMIVTVDGLLKTMLATGNYYFYQSGCELNFQLVDVEDPEIEESLALKLVKLSDAGDFIQFSNVDEGCRGLLYYNNCKVKSLDQGRYYFWKTARAVAIKKVDMRSQTMEIQGQELMTRDKVTLRINLSVQFRVMNSELVIEEIVDFRDAFYRIVQLALRESVSARSLEELLSNKNEVSDEISRDVKGKAEQLGLELQSSGIRDIILPGEMKTILNQVIEAEKKSQANMLQRREETAATRSLLNTAKLMENNPVLLRLKELEASERIAERVGSITVTGGLEGIFDAVKAAKTLS